MAEYESGPQSFRERQGGRFSSRSRNRRVRQFEIGSPRLAAGIESTFSRAASERSHTYLPGNMRGLFMSGLRMLGR